MAHILVHKTKAGTVSSGPAKDFNVGLDPLRREKNETAYEIANNGASHDQGRPQSMICIQRSLM